MELILKIKDIDIAEIKELVSMMDELNMNYEVVDDE